MTLTAAAGRVTAADVALDRDQPGFDRATMDGYALRLAPRDRYRVVHLAVPGERSAGARIQPSWFESGVDLTGRQLAVQGIQPPALLPESAVLIHLVAR